MEKPNTQLKLSNRNLDAFYYAHKKKAPGVIFLHDMTGVREVTHKTAELLHREGLQVLVPDLYSEKGAVSYCMRQLFNEYVRNNEPEKNPALGEIQEIIELFKSFENVEETKIGIVGQCLTGGFILHAAIRPEIKAPVVFHHSFGFKGSGIPSNCSAQIQNKVQGHFVNIDVFCPPSRVRKLKEEMGDTLQAHSYSLPHGIPHFFYNTKEGQLAFSRMIGFIKEKLVG